MSNAVPSDASNTPAVTSSVDLSGGALDAARAAFIANQEAQRAAAQRSLRGTANSGSNVPAVLPTIPSIDVVSDAR